MNTVRHARPIASAITARIAPAITTHITAQSAPMKRPRPRALAATLAAAACALALTGCVTAPSAITAEVQSYGAWPPGRQPADYVFERLPSQNDDPMQTAAVENAARGALERAGFRLAAEPASADIKVQAGIRLVRTTVEAWPADPFWPGPWYGPSVAWGLGWGFPVRGASFSFGFQSAAPAYASAEREVALVMRDGKTHQVLYETHARYDSRVATEALLDSLFDAALRDFPNGVGRRQVTVPYGPGVPVRAPVPGEPVGVLAPAGAASAAP
jgi:Domain of unknown function (DUF4136)